MSRPLWLTLLLLLQPLPALAELDVASWDRLLGAAVTDGHVDYAQWASNPEFDALIEQLAAADTAAMNRQQQLAFYINAYNILAARGILNGRSPNSVWGRYSYFKRDTYQVAGREISLHQLEHELLRPLQEARIHFAIVCASLSCPILRSEAYTAERLEQQLQQAARGFINNPGRNRFEVATGSAQLSRLFDWFEADFVAAAGSVQAYLAPLVENPEVAARLAKGEFKLSYLNYDWSLNGTL